MIILGSLAGPGEGGCGATPDLPCSCYVSGMRVFRFAFAPGASDQLRGLRAADAAQQPDQTRLSKVAPRDCRELLPLPIAAAPSEAWRPISNGRGCMRTPAPPSTQINGLYTHNKGFMDHYFKYCGGPAARTSHRGVTV